MGSRVFFSERNSREAKRFCLLSADTKQALVSFDEPSGSRVKIRNQRYAVIGSFLVKSLLIGMHSGLIEAVLGYSIPEVITLYAG